jgi:peptidoglycan/LPS O-acetylase OafA/YrhL
MVLQDAKSADLVNDSTWITHNDIAQLGNLPYLNGLRALAGVMIQIYHMAPDPSKHVTFFSWAALTTYYVQGAFLITGTLLTLQKRRKRPLRWYSLHQHVPRFFLARWIRLYPAVVLVLVINSVWWYRRYKDRKMLFYIVARALLKLSQSRRFFPIPGDLANPFANMWFLDVQEYFYLFWAVALPFVSSVNLYLRCLSLSAMFAYSYHTRINEDWYNATLMLNLYKMIAGASLLLMPIPRKLVLKFAEPLASMSLVAMLIWGFIPHFENTWSIPDQRILGDNVGILVTCFLILAAIARRTEDEARKNLSIEDQAPKSIMRAGKFVRLVRSHLRWSILLDILDTKPFNFVGRVMYSWYLWQVPLMHLEEKFRSGLKSIGPTAEAFIMALISTFLVEEPIRNAYVAWRKRNRSTT